MAAAAAGEALAQRIGQADRGAVQEVDRGEACEHGGQFAPSGDQVPGGRAEEGFEEAGGAVGEALFDGLRCDRRAEQGGGPSQLLVIGVGLSRKPKTKV